MGSFRDMPAEDGLSYGLSLLYRSGWAGTDPALIQLRALMEGLLAFDLTGAVYAYHQLTAALLQKGDRRVSGDLFKDHLLGLAVHQAHAFARMAARGQRDEALWMLMQEELSILGGLSQLTSQDVARYTRERQQALAMRPRQGKDALSVVATAAWGGGSTRPLPREDGEGPIPQPGPFLKAPFAFTPWQYGEPGLTDAYAADEALEEIYLRLLSAKDWGQLTEDLYNFFASYGCGPFLQHRGFRLEPDGSLTPLPESAFTPLIPTSLYEGERVRLMENTIRFLRGEPSENALLYGGAGTGKTAYVLSLLHEFPAARLILADPGDPTALTRLLQTLAGQPHRFLVLLDHMDLAAPSAQALSGRLCGGRLLPDNVRLYATARQNTPAHPLFPLALPFPYPSLSAFTRLVAEILEAEGIAGDPQAIHQACVDHQVDVRERLCFTGAKMLAEQFKG